MQRQTLPFIARNDVEVDVEHGLSGIHAVELNNHHPRRLEGRFHSPRDPLRRGDQLPKRRGAQVEDVLRRLARNDQRVPRALRHQVHEAKAVLFVQHHVGIRLAAEDFGEDVVGIVGHGGILSLPQRASRARGERRGSPRPAPAP